MRRLTKKQKAILFRGVLTIIEGLPGIFVAIFTDLGMPEKVAIASAIGAAISGVVNLLIESGVLPPVGGGTRDKN